MYECRFVWGLGSSVKLWSKVESYDYIGID